MDSMVLMLLAGLGLTYFGNKKGSTGMLVVGIIITMVALTTFIPGLPADLGTFLSDVGEAIGNLFGNLNQ